MAEQELSTAEAELYDRQIRLWGMESQERLRAANVLLIGVRGLGSEIAKDILLSGINSLTMLDDAVVTEEEQQKNFLLPRDCIGKKIVDAALPKAQALNPLVKIKPDSDSIQQKSDNFFVDFTIIIATELKTRQLLKIDAICRTSNIKFICGDVFGMFGFSLSDFQNHQYYEDRLQYGSSKKRTHDGKTPSNSENVTVKVQRTITYPAIEEVLPLSEKKIVKPANYKTTKRRSELYYLMKILMQFRDQNSRNPSYTTKDEDINKLLEIRDQVMWVYEVAPEKLTDQVFELVFGEIPSICAIVGGIIAQEVIKAVSQKEVPINNTFLLDPFTYRGLEETIGA